MYAGEPVVTLEEAILFTIRNDWLLNIEIKDLSGSPGHESIVEKVAGLVRSLGAVEKVLVSSFNYHYLTLIRKFDRDIKTGVLANSFQSDAVELMIELGAFAYNPGMSSATSRGIDGFALASDGVFPLRPHLQVPCRHVSSPAQEDLLVTCFAGSAGPLGGGVSPPSRIPSARYVSSDPPSTSRPCSSRCPWTNSAGVRTAAFPSG